VKDSVIIVTLHAYSYTIANLIPQSSKIFLLKIIMEANGLITLGKEYKIDHISLLTIKKTMIELMTMHRKLDVCTEYKSYQSSKTH
jgi:hypothetical protein